MSRKWIVFIAVTVLILVLDQATKWWIFTNLGAHDEIQVIPGLFSLVHAQNPGAAGGLFRNFEYRMWIFLGFTLVAVGIIINMQRQLPNKLHFLPTTLGLILGGALGNAIDRVHKQTVTDFLRVYTDAPAVKAKLLDWFGTAEWPSFNVADSALVVGVGLFVVHYLFLDEGELDGKPEEAQPDPEGTEDEATAAPDPG